MIDIYAIIPLWIEHCLALNHKIAGAGAMNENNTKEENAGAEGQLHLMSKELEEATLRFLMQVAELEKLLPLIDE